MGQSLAKVIMHTVFSTKDRADIIPDSLTEELYSYIVSSSASVGSFVYRVGGTNNHIHVACTLPRTITISSLLENMKSSSSKWIKRKCRDLRNFAWQNGYASFSISQSHLDKVVSYIVNQGTHHKRMDYKEEVIALLKKYEIEYDERFLWD